MKAKRLISAFLALLMLLSVFPVSVFAEPEEEGPTGAQDPVKYLILDEDGESTPGTCTEYTLIDGENMPTEWTSGFYVVDGEVTYGTEDEPAAVSVSGGVSLILTDRCTLTVYGGIQLKNNGDSLTVYAQSEGSGTGKLVSLGTNQYYPGIGGEKSDSFQHSVTVNIHGGDICAEGGTDAPGIGSEYCTVNIYGGNVTAQGGLRGVGIGGDINGGAGYISVYGGTVRVTGGKNARGIGYVTQQNITDSRLDVYGGSIEIAGGTISDESRAVAMSIGSVNLHPVPGVTAIKVTDLTAGGNTAIEGSPFNAEAAVTSKVCAGAVRSLLIEEHFHSFTADDYIDNKDGTHSRKCSGCDTYGAAEGHTWAGRDEDCHYCTVCEAVQAHDSAGECRDNEDGTHSRKCLTCGNYGAAEAHTWAAKDADTHVCTACEAVQTHDFTGEYRINEDGTHSRKCRFCDTYDAAEAHTWADKDGESHVCTVCEAVQTHDFTGEYHDNGNGTHSRKCLSCDTYGAVEAHTYTDGVCVCENNCVHEFTGEYRDNGNGTHSRKCLFCDVYGTAEDHTWAENDGESHVCTVCEAVQTHDFTGEYHDNGNGTHSRKCLSCDTYGAVEAHTYTDGVCVCGNKCAHVWGEDGFCTECGCDGSKPAVVASERADAKALIEAAAAEAGSTVSAVAEIAAAASDEIDGAETAAKVWAVRDLALAKLLAIAEISKTVKYETSDIASAAVADIQNAATVAEVTAIRDQALADMAAGLAGLLAAAKAEAVAKIEAEKYLDTVKIASAAITAVNNADSLFAVKETLAKALADMDAAHVYIYTDNGDGTHSRRCTYCGKYDAAVPHRMNGHTCRDCGSSVAVEEISFDAVARTFPTDLAKITCSHPAGWDVRFAKVGKDRDELQTVKIEKYPSVQLLQIDIQLYNYADNFERIAVNGNRVFLYQDFVDNQWVTLPDISISPDVIVIGGEGSVDYNCGIRAIRITSAVAHDFSAASYIDLGDGTHRQKCTACDTYSGPMPHVFVNGVCGCGAVCTDHVWGADGSCTLCGCDSMDPAVLAAAKTEAYAKINSAKNETNKAIAEAAVEAIGNAFSAASVSSICGRALADMKAADDALAAAKNSAVLAINGARRSDNEDIADQAIIGINAAVTPEEAGSIAAEALAAMEAVHVYTSDEYLDNGDGTHSRKCVSCDKYGPSAEHTFVSHVCSCCAAVNETLKLFIPTEEGYLSDKDFTVTATGPVPGGAHVGSSDHYVKIEANDPNVRINRAAFQLGDFGADYRLVPVNGEKAEEKDHTYYSGETVSVTGIDAPYFMIGGGGTENLCTVREIVVLYTVHDFTSGIYRDNGDGTHLQKCTECARCGGEPEAHSYEAYGICVCGKFCDHVWGENGVCSECGSDKNDPDFLAAVKNAVRTLILQTAADADEAFEAVAEKALADLDKAVTFEEICAVRDGVLADSIREAAIARLRARLARAACSEAKTALNRAITKVSAAPTAAEIEKLCADAIALADEKDDGFLAKKSEYYLELLELFEQLEFDEEPSLARSAAVGIFECAGLAFSQAETEAELDELYGETREALSALLFARERDSWLFEAAMIGMSLLSAQREGPEKEGMDPISMLLPDDVKAFVAETIEKIAAAESKEEIEGIITDALNGLVGSALMGVVSPLLYLGIFEVFEIIRGVTEAEEAPDLSGLMSLSLLDYLAELEGGIKEAEDIGDLLELVVGVAVGFVSDQFESGLWKSVLGDFVSEDSFEDVLTDYLAYASEPVGQTAELHDAFLEDMVGELEEFFEDFSLFDLLEGADLSALFGGSEETEETGGNFPDELYNKYIEYTAYRDFLEARLNALCEGWLTVNSDGSEFSDSHKALTARYIDAVGGTETAEEYDAVRAAFAPEFELQAEKDEYCRMIRDFLAAGASDAMLALIEEVIAAIDACGDQDSLTETWSLSAKALQELMTAEKLTEKADYKRELLGCLEKAVSSEAKAVLNAAIAEINAAETVDDEEMTRIVETAKSEAFEYEELFQTKQNGYREEFLIVINDLAEIPEETRGKYKPTELLAEAARDALSAAGSIAELKEINETYREALNELTDPDPVFKEYLSSDSVAALAIFDFADEKIGPEATGAALEKLAQTDDPDERQAIVDEYWEKIVFDTLKYYYIDIAPYLSGIGLDEDDDPSVPSFALIQPAKFAELFSEALAAENWNDLLALDVKLNGALGALVSFSVDPEDSPLDPDLFALFEDEFGDVFEDSEIKTAFRIAGICADIGLIGRLQQTIGLLGAYVEEKAQTLGDDEETVIGTFADYLSAKETAAKECGEYAEFIISRLITVLGLGAMQSADKDVWSDGTKALVEAALEAFDGAETPEEYAAVIEEYREELISLLAEEIRNRYIRLLGEQSGAGQVTAVDAVIDSAAAEISACEPEEDETLSAFTERVKEICDQAISDIAAFWESQDVKTLCQKTLLEALADAVCDEEKTILLDALETLDDPELTDAEEMQRIAMAAMNDAREARNAFTDGLDALAKKLGTALGSDEETTDVDTVVYVLEKLMELYDVTSLAQLTELDETVTRELEQRKIRAGVVSLLSTIAADPFASEEVRALAEKALSDFGADLTELTEEDARTFVAEFAEDLWAIQKEKALQLVAAQTRSDNEEIAARLTEIIETEPDFSDWKDIIDFAADVEWAGDMLLPDLEEVHVYTGAYVSNGNGTHSHLCENCGKLGGPQEAHLDYDRNNVCDLCGAALEPVVYTGASLTLGSDLDLNIFVAFETGVVPSAEALSCTVGGVETEGRIGVSKDGRTIFICPVNTLQMADTVVVVYTADGVDYEFEYSVLDYLASIIAGDYIDEAKTAAKKLIGYGHYAQIALKETHGFADDKYTAIGMPEGESAPDTSADRADEYAPVSEGSDGNITGLSISLTLDGRTAVNLYVTCGDVPDDVPVVKIDGAAAAAVKTDGRYRVTIPDIAAGDLGVSYRVKIGGLTLDLSALSYVNIVLNSPSRSQDYKNAMAALYDYYLAAVDYAEAMKGAAN